MRKGGYQKVKMAEVILFFCTRALLRLHSSGPVRSSGTGMLKWDWHAQVGLARSSGAGTLKNGSSSISVRVFRPLITPLSFAKPPAIFCQTACNALLRLFPGRRDMGVTGVTWFCDWCGSVRHTGNTESATQSASTHYGVPGVTAQITPGTKRGRRGGAEPDNRFCISWHFATKLALASVMCKAMCQA